MAKVTVKSSVEARIEAVKAMIPAAREQALTAAGSLLVKDALTQDPIPAEKTGRLKRSWALFIGSKLIRSGSEAQEASTNQNDDTATVGFYAPYAAEQHEGVGGKSSKEHTKFLESKIIRNTAGYVQAARVAFGRRLAKETNASSLVNQAGPE